MASALIHGIIHLYPKRLHQRHGREMHAHFMRLGSEMSQTAPRTGWIRLVILAALDTMRRAPVEWVAVGWGAQWRWGWGWGWPFDSGGWRRALRSLWRRPGFTAACLATLALAIGANTLIFTIVNGVLLRPLPYPESDRLVIITQTNERWRHASNPTLRAGADLFSLSYPVYRDWTELPRAFESLGVYTGGRYVLSGRGPAQTLYGSRVTHEVFQVLRGRALVGRVIAAEDDRVGAERTAVISEGAWRRIFGGDTAIVGGMVTFDGVATRIVGVMPSTFAFPHGGDVWAPLEDVDRTRGRNSQFLTAVARLRDGWTLERARDDMRRVTQVIRTTNPGQHDDYGVNMRPYPDTVYGGVRSALFVLLAAVGVVLIIGCVNVANLLLVQASDRRRELALRAALGASRWRLLQELWRESWLVAVAGGALGVLLAAGLLRPALSMLPRALPRAMDLRLDWWVLGFALGISTLAAVLVSVVPMMRIARTDPGPALAGSRGDTARRETVRLNSALVVAQVALTFALVIGAVLLGGELRRLTSTPLGFEPRGVLTAYVNLPENVHREDGQTVEFFRRVSTAVGALPGVMAVGGSTAGPFSGSNSSSSIGFEAEAGPDTLNVALEVVFGEYFAALGVPLLRGRTMFEALREGTLRPVVINKNFSDRFWPTTSPIGDAITYRNNQYTIVGVAGDVRHLGFTDSFRPRVYFPLAAREQVGRSQLVVVRAGVEPGTLTAGFRTAFASVDPDVPVEGVGPMTDQVARRAASPRFYTFVLSAFAGLAAVLAFVGIAGVLSYSVVRRRAEIGVRMALGASRGAIVAAVVRRGLALAATGIGFGLALGAATTRGLRVLMDDVQFVTPSVLALGVAVLAAAIAASAIPAWRAARVSPRTALTTDV